MEIVITGTSMSVEDKRQADTAPVEELPRLTDESRAMARKFGLSDEQWARGLLAAQYGDARLRGTATALAHVLEENLPRLLPEVEIERLIWNVGLEDHAIWLRYRGENRLVHLPQTSVDDWTASGRPEDYEQLCRAIARQIS